jgi:DNA-binding NarL/FixJ family response regulator
VLRQSLFEALDQEADLVMTKAFVRGADVPAALTPGTGGQVILCEAALFEPADVEGWTSAGAGVVLVADQTDEHLLVPAVLAGARGWVATNDPYDLLPRTVRCVARGGSQMPPELLAHLLTSLAATARGSARGAPAAELLTDRERQVLQLLGDGHTRKEIAAFLNVSMNTVRTHVRRILRKLEVHSAVRAVAVGRRLGVLHPLH